MCFISGHKWWWHQLKKWEYTASSWIKMEADGKPRHHASQCSLVIFNYRCALLRCMTAVHSLEMKSCHYHKLYNHSEPWKRAYIFTVHFAPVCVFAQLSSLPLNTFKSSSQNNNNDAVIMLQIFKIRTFLNIKVIKCFRRQQKKDSIIDIFKQSTTEHLKLRKLTKCILAYGTASKWKDGRKQGLEEL